MQVVKLQKEDRFGHIQYSGHDCGRWLWLREVVFVKYIENIKFDIPAKCCDSRLKF